MNSLKKGSGKQNSRSGSQDKIPDSESRKKAEGRDALVPLFRFYDV